MKSKFPDIARVIRFWKPLREQVAEDVEEEIRFHLEMRTDELERAGMAEGDARKQAIAEFGDPVQASQELRRQSVGTERRFRRVEHLDQLRRDFVVGWRRLRKSPAFTAVAVLTLALGIGATTAIYSVVRGILLKPLDLPESERLVAFWPQRVHTPRLFAMLNDTSSVYGLGLYESLAGWSSWTITLTGTGEPERLNGARTTADYFRVMGAQPALGRTFAPDEDQPGRSSVVVLGDGVWRRRFGADPGIVGTTIRLQGEAHTVLGVMPPSFRYPRPDTEIWLPYEMSPERGDYRASFLNVVGRLGPETSRAQAQAELDLLIERIHERNPGLDPRLTAGASITGLRDQMVGDVRSSLRLLFGAVAFVLLLACTNLASLLFGRALARRREIAVCSALGAGRGRLARELLIENLLLAAVGGGAGILLAILSGGLLVRLLPAGTPRLSEVGIDVGVLAFAGGITLLSSLLFGLLPALWASRPGISTTLREARGEAIRSARLRNGLVVAEVTLGVVLVLTAGLLIKSFYRLQSVDPGFVATGVLTLALSPERSSYVGQPEKSLQFYDRILTEVEAIPGVESVGLIQVLPMSGTNRRGGMVLEDKPDLTGEDRPVAEFRVAGGEYFRALGIPLLEGRAFSESDHAGAPAVALVNERFARAYWRGENAIGKRLQIPLWRDSIWHTVVGVVGDIEHNGLGQEATPEVYINRVQYPREVFFKLVIKSSSEDLAGLAPAVRERVWAIDPNVPISTALPLSQIVAETVAQPRLLMWVLSAFGAVALALGAMGIYGVMDYYVRRRTREMGIRLALGSRRSRVGWLVVRRGLVLTAVGLVLGLVAALALQELLAGLLYEVRPDDPWTLGFVVLGVLATGLLACYLPALRASRVEPAAALREE